MKATYQLNQEKLEYNFQVIHIHLIIKLLYSKGWLLSSVMEHYDSLKLPFLCVTKSFTFVAYTVPHKKESSIVHQFLLSTLAAYQQLIFYYSLSFIAHSKQFLFFIFNLGRVLVLVPSPHLFIAIIVTCLGGSAQPPPVPCY